MQTRAGSDPCMLRPVHAPTRACSDPCRLRLVLLAPNRAASDPCRLRPVRAPTRARSDPCRLRPVQAPTRAGFDLCTSDPRKLRPLQAPTHASSASWLRRPIRLILFKCFHSFTNPPRNGAFWGLGRLVAQEADLYKSFTKRSILESRGPHGSGGRSANSFSNASNPLQTLYKTEHSGAPSASWLKRPILRILLKCFNFI